VAEVGTVGPAGAVDAVRQSSIHKEEFLCKEESTTFASNSSTTEQWSSVKNYRNHPLIIRLITMEDDADAVQR
jgi:hypothetical protein